MRKYVNNPTGTRLANFPESSNPSATMERLFVLIVEDDDDTAQTAATILEHWGYVVEIVADGERIDEFMAPYRAGATSPISWRLQALIFATKSATMEGRSPIALLGNAERAAKQDVDR